MRALYPTLWLLLLLAAPEPQGVRAGEPRLPPLVDPYVVPGRLVDVGGYRLHIYCVGPEDAPSVLFDAGLGGFSMDWWFVLPELARDTRACAYDRAGYGWSDMGPSPRVTEQIVEEMDALIEGAGLSRPLVLVGHSFGGYNVRYYAVTHREAVAGLVLVDSSHPDQAERLPSLPVESEKVHRGTQMIFYDPRPIHAHYPEEMWFTMGALMSSGKALATHRREFANFEVSAYQVREAGPVADLPLVVISRGRRVWPDTPLGSALEKAWQEMQRELAASVPGSRQLIARHSGHLVQLEEPALVAGAVREVIAEACRRRGGECQVRKP